MRRPLVIVAIVLVVAGCGSGRSSSVTTTSPSTGVTAADQSVVDVTNASSSTFRDIPLNGKGNATVKLPTIGYHPAILSLSFKGDGGFAVWTVDDQGTRTELLVDAADRYSGTTAFNVSGTRVDAIEIRGTGAWSGRIRPLETSPRWDARKPLKGKGDAVYRVPLVSGESTILDASAIGDAVFTVWAYTSDGAAKLLVNESGDYTGAKSLPPDTVVLVVQASGEDWWLSTS